MVCMAVGQRVVVSMVRTLESNDAGASCANDRTPFGRKLRLLRSCANSVRFVRVVRSYLAERNKFKKLCLPFALLANGKHSLYGHLFADFTVKLSEPYRKTSPPACTSGSRRDPYASNPTNTMHGIRAHRLYAPPDHPLLGILDTHLPLAFRLKTPCILNAP